MDQTDFVTIRSRYRRNSYGDEPNSSLFETTSQSLPNTSCDISQNVISQEEIQKIKNDLHSAEQEIENLLTENMKLKSEIEKSNKLIEVYKAFKFSETIMTPITARRRKKPRKALLDSNINKKLIFLSRDSNQNSSIQDNDDDVSKIINENKKEHNDNSQTKERNEDIHPDQPINDQEFNTNTEKITEAIIETMVETSPGPSLDPNVKNTLKASAETTTKTNDEANNKGKITTQIGKTNNEIIQQEERTLDLYMEANKPQETKQSEKDKTTQANNETKVDAKIPKRKRKIIIIGDQQSGGMRNALQTLVGPKFLVTCFWKAGARLSDINTAERAEISTLTDQDYVILMGGINEVNPFEFTSSMIVWLHSNKNLNIIVCEIPYNKNLQESKLNYELRLICKQYNNVSFLDMNYGRFQSIKHTFTRNLSRSLLRMLLQKDYAAERDKYQNMLNQRHVSNQLRASKEQIDRCTQTDADLNENNDTSTSNINISDKDKSANSVVSNNNKSNKTAGDKENERDKSNRELFRV